MQSIRIGTRGSELALWQANHVKNQLEKMGNAVEIIVLKTQGDAIQQLSFDKLEGKGFFTKEIEEALLNHSIDLAVHSHKDLPTVSPQGLVVAAVSEREDPSDLLLIRKDKVDVSLFFSLQKNAVCGTSSLRRKTQLQAFRPDLNVLDLRGNVPTRIQKLRNGQYDAIVIAYAGVERLNLDISDLFEYKIPLNKMVPAPAQGVLALQIRQQDTTLYDLLQPLNSKRVKNEIEIERGVLNLFDGGCQLPLGVFCEIKKRNFKISVSKAISAEKAPIRMYFETEVGTKNFQNKIVAFVKNIRPCKVLITAETTDFSFFKKSLLDNGFEVESEPFVQTSPVLFNEIKKTDWIFFSSKKAVQYFFQNKIEIGNVKLAAVGEATAHALKSFGYSASFIGDERSTKLTAMEFAKKLQKKTVLFPQSEQSLKTIASTIPLEQCFFLDVYRTSYKPKKLEKAAEIIVFTSPSNALSFLSINKVSTAKLIAIGDSTYKAIIGLGYRNVFVARQPSELCLLEKVYDVASNKI